MTSSNFVLYACPGCKYSILFVIIRILRVNTGLEKVMDDINLVYIDNILPL